MKILNISFILYQKLKINFFIEKRKKKRDIKIKICIYKLIIIC